MASPLSPEIQSSEWLDDAARVAEDRFDLVRFTVTDINGISRSKLIPRRHVSKAFKSGVGVVCVFIGLEFRSGLVKHAEALAANLSNVIATPMPGTLHAVPWATDGKYRIGEVYCETFWMSPYMERRQAACPRYIARTQLERLEQLGYQIMSGYKVGCHVYRKRDCNDDVTNLSQFSGTEIFNKLILSEHEILLSTMLDKMSTAGVAAEAVHTEYSAGQTEFAIDPKLGIQPADQLVTLREAVKEISMGQGFWATFMSKPADHAVSSSGMQFSGSLWADGKNAFYDPMTHELSAVGRYWAAGLLEHANALTALCSPTVNCYRRLHSPCVPDKSDWTKDKQQRSTMLRMVAINPSIAYIKNRLPSSAANPYIVLAAAIAAGIDGLVNRLELASTQDLTDRPKPLPFTLSEALLALEDDKVLCEALGGEFIRWFVTIKRDVEIATVDKAKEEGRDVWEVERDMYFRFL